MKYLYQRLNGEIAKYEKIGDNEYMEIETMEISDLDNYLLLGKVSENIIELLENKDLVELEYKSPRYRERITRIFEIIKIDDGFISFKNNYCSFLCKEEDEKISDNTCKNIQIKSILTHEEFENRKFEVN